MTNEAKPVDLSKDAVAHLAAVIGGIDARNGFSNKKLDEAADTLRALRKALDEAELNNLRYLWLRDGNGYAPEENFVRGGEDLDKLCDEGIAEKAAAGNPL